MISDQKTTRNRKTGFARLITTLLLLALPALIWTQQQAVTLSSYAYCQYPSVAAADGGKTLLAVWVEQHSGYKYIYYRVYSNGVWSAKQLFAGTSWPEYPHVVADSQGNFHMVWMEGSGGGRDIAYARFSNGDWNTWNGSASDFVEITPDQRDVWPRLAIDPANDTLHAVWSKHRTTSVNYDAEVFHAQKAPGDGWSVERVSFDNYRRLNYHSDITARNNQVVTIWEQHTVGIYSSQRNTNGTWTTPVQVKSGGWKWPSIANDGNGNIHGLYGYSDVRYARRTNTGSWSEIGAINTYGRFKNHLDIRTDLFNNVYAVFQQGPEGPSDGTLTFLAGRLMLRRGDTNGNMDNAEVLWTRDVGFVHSPVVAPDNNGSVHIVWYDAGVGFPEDKWLDWGPVYYIKADAGPGASIQVLSPNGGEIFESGTDQVITWIASDSISNVHIEASGDNGETWYDVVASTENDGSFELVVPETPSEQCLIRISDASDGEPVDASDATFSIFIAGTIPSLTANRDSLNFGSENGNTTQSQQIIISNAGGGTLNWTASSDNSWLSCTPTAGSNTSIMTVMVSPDGLAAGTYTGVITIDAGYVANSPLNINVTLRVYVPGTANAPFGTFSTPEHNSIVRSSIPISGWALDDVEVESVKIYRETETGLVYIGDATFVEDARSDLESAYSQYPLNHRGGWGYMMLTYGLPNQGMADDFIIHAIARDKDGHATNLGSKLIHCDNQNATNPFGALATPSPGNSVSGNDYINWGWTLTPPPNIIPVDGSTISVIIDGVAVGNPVYNLYRKDIANIFPDYLNSEGASGYFHLDTTRFTNGLHTIAWLVEDDSGNKDGIGSRFFTILNVDSDNGASSGQAIAYFYPGDSTKPFDATFKDLLDDAQPIGVLRNKTRNGEQLLFPTMDKDVFVTIIEEVDLLQLRLNPNTPAGHYAGFLKVGEKLRRLPIGSTLDNEKGIFYWQPGPGFLGDYDFVFIDLVNHLRKQVKVTIQPKSTARNSINSR